MANFVEKGAVAVGMGPGVSGLSSSYNFSYQYNSIQEAQNAEIPNSVDLVILTGYYQAGDAPIATYIGALTEPTHPGKFQSANGRWFQITGFVLDTRQFGAKLDGITDDSLPINNAILVANFFGGGIVRSASGVSCVANTIVMRSNVCLQGLGIGTSTFKAITGCSHLIEIAGRQNVIINNLTLDHNKSAGTTGHGLRIAGLERGLFQELQILNGAAYCIGMQDGANKDIFFNNIIVDTADQDCIDIKDRLYANSNINFTNIIAKNPNQGGSGDYCIDLRGPGITVMGVQCFYGAGAGGIRFRNGDLSNPNGRSAEGSSLSNFYLQSSSATQGTGGISIFADNVAVSNGYVVGAFTAVGVGASGAHISNVSAIDCTVAFTAAGSFSGEANEFVNCRAIRSGGASTGTRGWLLSEASPVNNTKLIGCVASGSSAGIRLEAGTTNTYISYDCDFSNNTTPISDVSTTNSIIFGVGGPETVVANNFPMFSTTNGRSLADSGKAVPSGDVVGTTDTQILTNKNIGSKLINSWWCPPNGSSGAALSLTGTTAETILATISIPANSMGNNGSVRVTTLWQITNSMNSKQLRVRFNGISGTAYLNLNLTTNTMIRNQIEIKNRNLTNSQVGMRNDNVSGFGAGTTGPTTSSVDTLSAVDLVITGQLADASENITLHSYTVEILSS